MRANKAEVRSFLKNTTEKTAAALRGQVFDNYCHNLFQEGTAQQSFRVKDLDSEATDMIGFPRISGKPAVIEFDSLEDLVAKYQRLRQEKKNSYPQIYGVPTKENFPVLDAVLLPDCVLYQMTVSLDHPPIASELSKQATVLQNAFHKDKKHLMVKLCYVVPDDVYGEFKKQKLLTKQGDESKSPGVSGSVCQFCMCTSLD